MKKILLLAGFVFLNLNLFAQKVEVSEKSHDFDGVQRNAIEVVIPYGTTKEGEKVLKDELKDWKGKYSSKKDVVFVDDAYLKKDIGENTFDVYATVVDKGNDQVSVVISIDLGGAHLSSSMHPEQYKIIETKMRSWGVEAAKEIMLERIKDEEKVLSNLEKDLENLQNKKEKIVKDVADANANIAAAEATIEHTDKDSEDGKKEIKKQENTIDKSKKDIAQGEKDIEKNKQDQEQKKAEIEDQKKKIEEMRGLEAAIK